jgi:hypothetical protein
VMRIAKRNFKNKLVLSSVEWSQFANAELGICVFGRKNRMVTKTPPIQIERSYLCY